MNDYEKTFHSRHQFGIPYRISSRHMQADVSLLAPPKPLAYYFRRYRESS